jgi:hypothetical protein
MNDHTGNLRKLSELPGDHPLILTLARGQKASSQNSCSLSLFRHSLRIVCGTPGQSTRRTFVQVADFSLM